MNAVLDQLLSDQREQDAAEALLRKLFAAAVQRGDVRELAVFARRGCTPTFSAVLEDALAYRGFMTRAMQILVNAANGKGTQRDAQQLLEEAGAVWASLEVGMVLP